MHRPRPSCLRQFSCPILVRKDPAQSLLDREHRGRHTFAALPEVVAKPTHEATVGNDPRRMSLGSSTGRLDQLGPTPSERSDNTTLKQLGQAGLIPTRRSSATLPPLGAQNATVRRRSSTEKLTGQTSRRSSKLSQSMSLSNLDDASLVDLSSKLPMVVRQTCSKMNELTKTLRELHEKNPQFFANTANYNALVNISFEAKTGHYYFAKWKSELAPHWCAAPSKPTMLSDWPIEGLLAELQSTMSGLGMHASSFCEQLQNIIDDTEVPMKQTAARASVRGSAWDQLRRRGFCSSVELLGIVDHLERMLAKTHRLVQTAPQEPPAAGRPRGTRRRSSLEFKLKMCALQVGSEVGSTSTTSSSSNECSTRSNSPARIPA